MVTGLVARAAPRTEEQKVELWEDLPLSVDARAYLERVRAGLSLMADLSRSDLFIYVPDKAGNLVIYAHARPHSMASLYPEELTGRRIPLTEVPGVGQTLATGRVVRWQREILEQGAPLLEAVYPLYLSQGTIVGALVIETNMMEAERLKLRSRVFRYALRWIRNMLIAGNLENVAHISPFREMDGIILVDSARVIRYMSGRGRGIYRRLGYLGDLVGYPLRHLDTDDNRLVIQAFTTNFPLEVEVKERERYLIKSVIPIHAPIPFYERWLLRLWHGWRWPPYGRIWQGAFILVRDVTEERRSEEELRTKSMLLREVHHRVKNNLQTIASLLRMQARRIDHEEARRHLLMAASRVRAVADIHEFLQYQEGGAQVGMRELCQQVLRHVRDAVLPDDIPADFRVEGPNIRLVGQQATAMALIVNELVLNAINHSATPKRPRVVLQVLDMGPLVRLQVINPGDRLPEDFDLGQGGGLGLKIVQTLVKNELGGEFRLYTHPRWGVVAEVTFQKRKAS